MPFLPAERIARHAASADFASDFAGGRPYALTDKVKGAIVLQAVDRMAAALDLAPGMKLADARARVPDLLAFDTDRMADAALLDRLARACLRYTPMVSAAPPDALLLDISGSAHFFDDETALAHDAEDRLDHAGFGTLWAIAGTPDAALALARHGLREGAEAQLPVSALAMDDKTHRALERAGLYHIGDLATRPRAALVTRFGSELGLRLDRILGIEDRPVNPLQITGNISVERRFAEPLTHLNFALTCLTELFEEAATALEKRGKGARMIRMMLFRCDGATSLLHIETGAATRDTALFKRLLHERIGSLDDPLNPGFGYDLMRLTVTAEEPLAVEQYQLEGSSDRGHDEQALVSQLSTRLGRNAVRQFMPADSHIPEQGLLALPALDISAPRKWDIPGHGQPPLRPLHLFDPPQRIQVIAEVPDGPPHRFTWRRKIHQICRYEGPERIASQWWRKKDGQQAGKGGLTRDYYRIEDVRGRRYWVFRHGLYGSEKTNPDWYIHGLFA